MLGGSILRRCAELLDARDPEAAIARAIELIGETLDASYGPLVAIGVSIAADIDPTAGVPIAAPTMPAWVGFPLGSRLARVYNTRIYVDNDVNALALREMIARRSNAPFLVVKISHGIGCGIVVDGSLFRGIEGSAGDIGHICLDPADETRCACGNRGCLEAVAATPAVIAKADTLARTGASAMLARFVAEHGSLTEDLVGQAASGGDEAAARLLKEQGRRIGYVLSGLVSFFNPSAVLIASGLGAGRAILLSAVRQAVYERALPAATRKLEIGEATLDEDDAVVGSAILGSYGYLGSSGSRALHHGLEPN
jgi:predicted NBD/HSP70 family sugar kinase